MLWGGFPQSPQPLLFTKTNYLIINLFHYIRYFSARKEKNFEEIFHWHFSVAHWIRNCDKILKTKEDAKMIYLNVGSGKSIREKNIIGIFDMDTSTVSPITRKLLSEADKAHLTESPSYEIPKSFIIYRAEDGQMKVCFSQFSSASLLGRVKG